MPTPPPRARSCRFPSTTSPPTATGSSCTGPRTTTANNARSSPPAYRASSANNSRKPSDAAYNRAWQRQHSRRGHRHRRLRRSTVEPVFGHLLPHYGLRRLNVCGLAGAHKTVQLTVVVYNPKKLLKPRPQQQVGGVVAPATPGCECPRLAAKPVPRSAHSGPHETATPK